jgi:hypothetical protein
MSVNNSKSATSQTSPDVPRYHYQRLQDPRSIRLWELMPDRKGARLRCNMLEVSLDDAPKYEAVSYVWGAPKLVRRIFCGIEAIYITKNCFFALHHLRNSKSSRFLWIDACCIDQRFDLERNHQVGMMGRVYSTADCTVVWLGKATHHAEDRALVYIHNAGRDNKANAGTRCCNTCLGSALTLWTGLPKGEAEYDAVYRLFGLYHFFDKAWFHRVWVGPTSYATEMERCTKLSQDCTKVCAFQELHHYVRQDNNPR